MSKSFGLFFLVILVVTACQEAKPTTEMLFPKQLNLLQHGIPIALQVPEDAKVSNRSDNFMQDVVIEGKNYYVQIYSQNATSFSCASLAGEAQSELKTSDPNFQKVVSQDDCGFVYEVQVPGDSTKCYNFNFFRVQGNKSYSFTTTTGRTKPFTLEQVQQIYAAVKEQK